MSRDKYKISVLTLQNKTLVFHVDDYSIIDGFVSFTDKRTDRMLSFHSSKCEIETIKGDLY